MTDQLLSELRKMRSTRTNLGLLAGMVALILLTVLLTGLVSKAVDLTGHDNQHSLLSTGTAAALFASLIGVMAITSEFRHGTIRSTFVVTPRRTRVVWAKVIASLLMGILFGLAAIGLSFGIGYLVLRARGIPLELEPRHIVWLFVGTPLITAAWAAMPSEVCEEAIEPLSSTTKRKSTFEVVSWKRSHCTEVGSPNWASAEPSDRSRAENVAG